MGPNLNAYMRCDYSQKTLHFSSAFSMPGASSCSQPTAAWGLTPAMALPLLQNISMLEEQAITAGAFACWSEQLELCAVSQLFGLESITQDTQKAPGLSDSTGGCTLGMWAAFGSE